MRLSFREKQNLYYELSQLARSGIAFPAALRTLSNEATGSVRALLLRLEQAIDRGDTVAQAFAQQRPAVAPMESSVIGASERSGRIDQGCQRLSAYFTAMAQARDTVIKKSLYPVFVFHFGVFMLGLPRLIIGSGLTDYLTHTLGVLFGAYACGALLWLACSTFAKSARSNAAADRFWRALPVLGKIRTGFALARFCATYEMQLNSGVNVLEALVTAGCVSQSATIQAAVETAVPAVRAGEKVGPLLAKTGAFPSEMMRAFRVGEETGGLDEELRRLTENFERQALDRVETLSEWIPRVLYTFILLYMGFEIVQAYRNILAGYGKVLDPD